MGLTREDAVDYDRIAQIVRDATAEELRRWSANNREPSKPQRGYGGDCGGKNSWRVEAQLPTHVQHPPRLALRPLGVAPERVARLSDAI